MRGYLRWLKIAAFGQFVTAFIHALSLFFRPPPSNETERQLFDLMENYQFDLGAGFHRSMGDLTTGLSICFCLVCLLGGLVNIHLLRSNVSEKVITGVININLLVFGLCFVAMCVFTFLPPILLTGIVVAFLILSRVVLKRSGSIETE